MATEILHFYTNGPEFTNLVRDFIKEGSYSTAHEILDDGGMSAELIALFFLFELEFEGTTKDGGYLTVVPSAKKLSEDELASMLYDGIRTALNNHNEDEDYDINDICNLPNGKVKKNIDLLFSIFGKDRVIRTITPKILKSNGFIYHTEIPKIDDNKNVDGIILSNGAFIQCGSQEHNELYPLLYALGYIDASDWIYESTAIHISSNQISGTVATTINHGNKDSQKAISQELIDTLFNLRHYLIGQYGDDDKIATLLRRYIATKEDHGGKYNNLCFIKRFYPEINIPKISKTKLEGVEKQCIRTSPNYSLPGLLESVFDITETSISEIETTFEKYKNVVEGNVLHYFYQEFIEGHNGVCNCFDGVVTYDLSANQGDVVKGITGNIQLNPKPLSELKRIARQLNNDFDMPVQLEFVVNDDKLTIVQFRILENNYDNVVIVNKPNVILASGKTFSKGNIEVDVEDILVIQSDTDSKNLLNKKALIVRDDVQFSHALALSKVLRIPSLYAVGNINLPASGKVIFTAHNREGWITIAK